MPTLDPIAVPLLLGVTGPREINAERAAAIGREIAALCAALRTEYPQTPLVLLSPLVAGADQLAAEAVLGAGESVRLAVVLPWAKHAVDDDPARYGAREQFDPLREQAAFVIEMPWAQTDDGRPIDAERVQTDADARTVQYGEVGRYIARHAQILIAVWDEGDRPTGQTAQMVEWHREGTAAPRGAAQGTLDLTRPTAIYYVSPTGLTARPEHVVGATLEQLGIKYPPLSPPKKIESQPPALKPRTKTERLTDFFVALKRRFPRLYGGAHHAKSGKNVLHQRWQSFERFNRDARSAEQHAADLAKSRGYLLPADEAARSGPCIERLLDAYARADAAALDYQRRSQRVVRRLFLLAALAVAAHETYAHGWHEWYVLAAYPLLLIVGYFWFNRSQRRNFQGRWLDLRALAETLRVQTFWQLAGRPECTADYYLRHFRGELDWIRHAARALFLTAAGRTTAECMDPQERLRRLQTVRSNWVVDQLNYFVDKAPLHHRLETAFETAARTAFLAAMALSVIHVFWHLAHHMSHGLVLATFACLVTAAFLEEYSELQTYALTARRYEWMADVFAVAERRLTKTLLDDAAASAAATDAQRIQQAQAVVFELGREALAENADWVVQHRHRPPTLPAG